jgi:carbamoyl-phosphate synthase large subunit
MKPKPSNFLRFGVVTHLALCNRMAIQSYRDLQAWQLGMAFVLDVYQMTARLPADERYGLTAQMRRAAVSVPSNVSEGHQLGGKSYKRSISLALGSLAEATTQTEIALRLKYIDDETFTEITRNAARLRQVLHGLRRALVLRERRT